VHAVPVDSHACHAPDKLAAAAQQLGLAASACASVADALATIGNAADRKAPPVVLIAGSLYLAGAVLRENGPLPG
jgi:dihydrofolate synthase/folylpolyglutamate synthase